MAYIIILLLFVPTVIFTAVTPYITRKTESFGVSIPEEIFGSPELAGFRKKYALRTSIFGAFLLLASMYAGQFPEEETWMILFLSSLFLFIVGSFLIYLQFHKKMKDLKAASNWHLSKTETSIIDTNFRKQKLTYSYGWFAIPLAIIAITFVMTIMYYQYIPSKMPMQFDFNGEVTRWATKSYRSALAMPLMQLFMLGLFMFINYTIARSRQQVDASNPEKSVMQNIIFRRRWSGFIIMTGTLLIILFGLIQLSLFYPINVQVLTMLSFILTGVIVLAAVILSIITGQGGSRIKTITGKHGEMINRDEDRYWKLGIFYFNGADPAIWVEKRFGSGWTVNMAKPQAWIFFVIILVIPILIGLLS
ncbi:DUF1648 domain-containing protein [Lederbergia citrea]|uniref:DUF1648 domain-containing protein n=1 Tax=Lederbergia citrea TaxID=2833581 RepID=A0A942USS4_9BACI|nr:DUF1648 domain-containing protein [Lederbergia citrea]MBS4224373.1 DUF1648 domain-containing protein [Lederbergia citrea]